MRRERARGRLRRSNPDEAAQLWSVLVAGRWSIVDFIDRDGKRMLLARKNPVNGPDVLALTDQERDILWLATLGHSRKYIAYEVGLAPATVTKRLTSAMKKVDVAVYEVLRDHSRGTFVSGVRQFGLAQGVVDIAYSGGSIEDIRPQIEDLRAGIIAGEIVVPSEPAQT